MYYFIYIIMVVSTIFQDFILKNQLGFLGTSLTAVIIPIFYLILIFSLKKVEINRYTKLLIKLYIYLILISLVSVCVHTLIFNGSVTFWNQNIFLKGFKASVYFFEIILFMIIIENLQSNISIRQIFLPIIVTYIILLILLFVETYNSVLFNNLFHQSQYYNRIRLTTPESSTTGTLFTTFFILSFHYFNKIRKNILLKYLMVVFYIPFILTSHSKGFFVCIFLAFILLILSKVKKTKQNIFSLLIALFIVFIFFRTFFYKVYFDFSNDLRNFTSFATRAYTTYCALKVGIIYPFGIGTSLYPIIFTNSLINNIGVFNLINSSLNLQEIYSMIYSVDGNGVAAKIPIAQYNMYWGIIGSCVFIYCFWINIYRKSNILKQNTALLFGYIYIFLSVFSYVNFENKYEIWLYIITIISLGKISSSKAV